MIMMHHFGIIFAIIVVVSGKNFDLVINETRNTWISLINFTRIIEASLNSSVCTNVLIAGNSAELGHVFGEFVRVYPNDYILNSGTFACSGYLGISSSSETIAGALNRVPTKISTTEILIVIDDRIDESEGLFNVSLYDNANANIVARNGLWSLSENFLHPRRFRKASSYREMVHKRGIVDLEARELQAAAFLFPPLSYLNTTVNRTVKGIEGEFFTVENGTEKELDGVEVKLFLLIAKRLNFTWTLRKPNHNFRYGRRNGTTWNGGMIGQIYRNEIDIAFTGIWLEIDNFMFANLTFPWTRLDIRFLVPRPKPYTSFWALTRPLSPKVWAALILMLLVQSVYVYTRAWIKPRIPKKFRNFVVTSTEMMARLLGGAPTKRIDGFQLYFQLWHFTGILVVTAYSSSLAASLTNLGYEERIDTAEQFIKRNLTWGREGPTPKFSDYFDESDPWAKQFKFRFEHEPNRTVRYGKIKEGNYAIIGRIVGGIFFSENFITDEDLQGYRVMRENVGQCYSTFAVQPWLINSFNQIMLWLQEGGLVAYHLRDVLYRRTTSAIYGVLIEHDGINEGARVLELIPLGAGFSMLIFGLTIATVVFYYEVKSVSDGKSLIDVFRKIAKRRRQFLATKKKRKEFNVPRMIWTINKINRVHRNNGELIVSMRNIASQSNVNSQNTGDP